MPVVWNAEAEAKLLAGLFKVCDIKVNAEQTKELAALIGPDCTPKAITHRVAKFRKMGGAFNGGKKGAEAAAEEDEEAVADKSPKKKGKKGDKGAAKKRGAAEDVEEDDDEEVSPKKQKVKSEDEDEM